MTAHLSLTNTFLIAMPGMNDPNFYRTVTYICEHNDRGAMGIIINRPLDLHLTAILKHLDISSQSAQTDHRAILWGGPVNSEQIFMIHTPPGSWESSLSTSPEIAITTSKDILQSLAVDKGPADTLIMLGYSGWDAGQLESEIAANLWLTSPVSLEILFKIPFEKRWEAAAAAIGFDFNNLSSDVGHA